MHKLLFSRRRVTLLSGERKLNSENFYFQVSNVTSALILEATCPAKYTQPTVLGCNFEANARSLIALGDHYGFVPPLCCASICYICPAVNVLLCSATAPYQHNQHIANRSVYNQTHVLLPWHSLSSITIHLYYINGFSSGFQVLFWTQHHFFGVKPAK